MKKRPLHFHKVIITVLSNIWNDICKVLLLLISLPKSILFNFYYLPLKQAIKLPILISYRLKLRYMGGSIQLDRASFGIVQIGFNSLGVITGNGDALWNLKGHIHFQGKARIGCHPIIQVKGHVTFGEYFETGHHFVIICDKKISFDDNILLSWHVEFMDTDVHHIMNEHQKILNLPKSIEVKSHTWIGSHVSVLKGSKLPEYSVVASRSVITKEFHQTHCLFTGSPAIVKKTNIHWKV